MKLERILLLLTRSAAQQQALATELADLANPTSPNYHQWLTPAAFAATYSNSAADVAAVSAWLESQGFQVAPLPAGRGWIEFSGTVAQVDQAFHTQVSSVVTAGGTRAVLVQGISVPAALVPVVQGLISLDGALSSPALTTPQTVAVSAAELAAETSPNNAEALTPQLIAQLLHLDTLHSAGINGAGESIAIAARSNVNSQDVAAFRAAFAFPATPLTVIPNGPGLDSETGAASDQAEATLAASWAGAAAPSARIVLVPAATTSATDGLDLSLAAIVDQALAHTVAVGYSECEAALSETHQAFYLALYRQAAAEGIAVIADAGDSGPSACHLAGSDAPVSSGYGVNALASTPWNTAVGVAAFSAAGPATGITALTAWSPASSTDPSYAGGGGGSTVYAAPIWQPIPKASQQGTDGTGNHSRLLPDLALPTAIDTGVNHGLAFCLSATNASSGCTLARSGGSSAASAIFAGIAALVAEKYGAQGNLAPNLYALSRQSGIFEDVQQGSAQLKCVAGSPGCGSTEQIGYTAGAGYDLATGLGAVNAQELVNHWATPEVTGKAVTVSIGVTPAEPNSTYNPAALVTLTSTVAPVIAGATPTGTVTFYNTVTAAALSGASTVTLNPSGTGTWMVNLDSVFTTAGTDSIGASYFDATGTYASNNSETTTITTAPSNTTLTVTPSNLTPTVGTTITVTVTFGVSTSGPPAGAVAPTGSVTLNINGAAFGTSPVSTVGSVTTATFSVPVTATAHTLQAVYAGDANYTSANGQATITVVTMLPVTVVLTSNLNPAPPGAAVILTATVTPNTPPLSGAEHNPSGNVIFYEGTTVMGEAALTAVLLSDSSTASITTQTLPGGYDMLTAVYLGDSSYDTETSNILTLGVQNFTLTPSPSNPPTNLDIVQGQSGTATFNLTGLGGFGDEIQVICAVPTQDDMTCTPTPQQIVPPGTVTFTIQTFVSGGPSASNNHREPIWPRAAGGTALAVLGFFLLPFGRRVRIFASRSTQRFLVLLLLLAGLCGVGMGCNSVSGLVPPTTGTPLGVATLKITAFADVDNTVVSQSVYLTVNVVAAP
jgi:subtilase family serine protease